MAARRKQAKPYVVLRHRLSRLLRPRLHVTIVTAFLCAVVVAEIIWLVPATIYTRAERMEALRREVGLMLQAAVDHTDFPTIETELSIGQRLMGMSPIEGGIFFNAAGGAVGSFGQVPDTDPANLMFQDRKMLLTGENSMETVFRDSETGLPHHVLVRLDTTSVNEAVLMHLWRSAVAIAAVFLFAMAVLFLILHYRVLRPVNRVREATLHALDQPHRADRRLSGLHRRDEVGELGRSIDQLLFGISLTYREDLLVMQDMLQNTPMAVITYRGDGSLHSINEGALKLLGLRSRQEFEKFDPRFLIFKTARRPQNLIESLENGDYRGQCRISTRQGERPILISASVHHDEDGQVMRYAMFAVDISRYIQLIEEQTAEIETFEQTRSGLRSQIAELKLAFESCLLAMEQEGSSSSKPDTVMPDRLVSGWLDTFQTEGEDNLFHESLPPVYGNDVNVRNIFRQALTFVQLKSVYLRPNLSISAMVKEHSVRFTIQDDSADAQAVRKSNDPAHFAWPLAMRGLISAMRREGGTIEKLGKGDKPYVVFSLPLDVDTFRENRKNADESADGQAQEKAGSSERQAGGAAA